MAEAVKNNGRKRRPPSHLREGYHDDNYEHPNNQHSATKDPFKGVPDLCPMSTMARLLAKFLNSANKKLLDSRPRLEDEQSSVSVPKHPQGSSLPQSTLDRKQKDQRYAASLKSPQASLAKPSISKQQASKQQFQRAQRLPLSTGGDMGQLRQPRNQGSSVEAGHRGSVGQGGMHPNIGNMSREQILKLMSKDYSSGLLKQQYLFPSDPHHQRMPGRFSNPRKYEFRQGTKLFKRASFHVGIAYNIHVDNIRHRNPNFSPEELDPTSVARRFKEENERAVKKQMEEQAKEQLTGQKPKQQQPTPKVESSQLASREAEKPSLSAGQNEWKNEQPASPAKIEQQIAQQPGQKVQGEDEQGAKL